MTLTESSYFLDYDHTSVQGHVNELAQIELSQKDRAIQLYLYVRDNWLYSANYINCIPKLFKASEIAKRKDGHCIDKSILLATFLRAFDIPTKLQFAKVKNHIAAEHLIERFGTNELTPHGMVNLYIENKWLKVSPAFNKSLCQLYNVDVLDFDGESDSIFHAFDRTGRLFMEYIEIYDSFDDVPFDFIKNNLIENYPNLKEAISKSETLYF